MEFFFPFSNFYVQDEIFRCVAVVFKLLLLGTFGTSWSISAVNNRQSNGSTARRTLCVMKNYIDFHHSRNTYTHIQTHAIYMHLFCFKRPEKWNNSKWMHSGESDNIKHEKKKILNVHFCNKYNSSSYRKYFQYARQYTEEKLFQKWHAECIKAIWVKNYRICDVHTWCCRSKLTKIELFFLFSSEKNPHSSNKRLQKHVDNCIKMYDSEELNRPKNMFFWIGSIFFSKHTMFRFTNF